MKNKLPKITGITLLLSSALILSGCDALSTKKKAMESEVVQNQIVATTETLTPTPTITLETISIVTPTVSASPSKTTLIPSKPPETEIVFTTYNIAGVRSGPTEPTIFTLKTARKIYTIQDYHWNSAKGKTPGTIGLKSDNGTMYGPWNAVGAPGQGGVPDAYWTVYPDTEIPAGTYTIIDSDPASWAQNSGTNGLGMSQVSAVK